MIANHKHEPSDLHYLQYPPAESLQRRTAGSARRQGKGIERQRQGVGNPGNQRQTQGTEDESALVSDYIRWRAPQLLLLPGLRHTTRDRLVQLAVNQAEAIDRLWRLYPEIHNEYLLNSARVEARIRTANRK